MNDIAATSTTDFKEYSKQVYAFQKRWRKFLYNYQLQDIHLKPEDLKKFPVYKQDQSYFKVGSVVSGSLLLWLGGLVFIFIGSMKIKS